MFRRLIGKHKKDASASVTQSPASLSDLFRERGDERVGRNDYNGAVAMYDEALRHAPSDTTILLSRSIAHMESTPPNLHLALQDAVAATRYSPENWRAWMQRGEACLRVGDIQEAEEAMVKAEAFAQGLDKLFAKRNLATVRDQQKQIPPAAEPSAASTESAPPGALSQSTFSAPTQPSSSGGPSQSRDMRPSAPAQPTLGSAPAQPAPSSTLRKPTLPDTHARSTPQTPRPGTSKPAPLKCQDLY
ncbi:hypothetical protein GP486_006415 [Trichoglossum hirsutum]|uniref:Uncharacterized protein n=1 Tax=Trichoglossum hirsutum TaxID=265104 RepID=A0A9P8IH62_9PEZI|nr:hypothetical protein GP486_006415 [Trichoglossum hirsutum]